MENIALWLTVFGGSILTFAGWIINRLVTNRIDDLEKGRKEDRDLFFTRLDAVKAYATENLVRKDIYEQASAFHKQEIDGKFSNLVDSINKLDKDLKDRVEDIKTLILKNFNNPK